MRVFRETSAEKALTFNSTLWTWQYRAGPRSLVVVAEEAGELCGYYHVLLMPHVFGGDLVTAGLVQDVGVLARHRRRGIFRRMGTFALDQMQNSDVAFAYAFPNERSLHSFVSDHGYDVRTELPLCVSPFDLGGIALARLPRARRFIPSMLAGLPMRLHQSIFLRRGIGPGQVVEIAAVDPRIPPLADQPSGRLAVQKDSRYLKWRFQDRPDVHYQIFGLVEGPDLCAYVVTRVAEIMSLPCVVIMDAACEPGDAGKARLRQLLSARLQSAAHDGAVLAVTIVGARSWGNLLSLGFVSVPRFITPRRMRVVVKPLLPGRLQMFGRDVAWDLSLADWDVL